MVNKICAIIVLYNPELDLLKKQFQSLQGQVDYIVYIDNNSSNITDISNFINISCLANLHTYLILNSNNFGLGYAHNQGIEKAKLLHASHILLLDHDSVLQNLFVNNLINTEKALIDKGYKIGAIGPKYLNETTGEVYPITRYIGPFIKRIKPTNTPIEASFLISSGCYISLKVINDIGGMNEDLFVDYIDVEWSFRARSNGYKLYVSPKAVMNHKIGDKRTTVLGRSISIHTPLRRYYLSRNSVYMLKDKNVSFGYKVRELVFNILRLIVFFFLSKDRFKYLKYSFVGLFDGIKGVKGKCSIIKY